MKPYFDDFTPSIPRSSYGPTELSQRPLFTHSVLGPDGLNTEMACTTDAECPPQATCDTTNPAH
jgi:hypothetical protein